MIGCICARACSSTRLVLARKPCCLQASVVRSSCLHARRSRPQQCELISCKPGCATLTHARASGATQTCSASITAEAGGHEQARQRTTTSSSLACAARGASLAAGCGAQAGCPPPLFHMAARLLQAAVRCSPLPHASHDLHTLAHTVQLPSPWIGNPW